MSQREGTVTIRIERRTKRWLEAFQKNQWEKTGKTLNNDEAVAELLKSVDPDAIKTGDRLWEQEGKPKLDRKRGKKDK
jgi:hypothetical protein